MKKNFIITLTAVCIISSSAFAQVKFAVNSGATYCNYRSTETVSPDFKLRYKAGFTGGAQVDIPAGRHFGIQTGLNFLQKGLRQEAEVMGEPYNFRGTLNYLEMPVNFLYNTHHATGNFFAGAGASLAYGLTGKYIMELGDEREVRKFNFGDEDATSFKRMDAGVNVITGYRFGNGIFASVNYTHGLTQLDKDADPDDDEKVNSRCFAIRVGYQFGHRK